MAKVKVWRTRHLIRCPGCKETHHMVCKPQHPNGWTFNGDLERPTFQPSLLATWTRDNGDKVVCHSYITNGRIQFLDDCTHALRGQTVDLLEFDGTTLEERAPGVTP